VGADQFGGQTADRDGRGLTGDRPGHLQVVGMALGILGAVVAGGPELSGRTLRSAQARNHVRFAVAVLSYSHAGCSGRRAQQSSRSSSRH